jgi:nitroreductase
MELVKAVRTRRSVRKYKNDRLPEQTLRELITLATWAPSAMNCQPWSFAVVENKDFLKKLSESSKAALLANKDAMTRLERYRNILSDPQFDLFYGAPVLVLIYGNKNIPTYVYDCSMAALNLMLAAWDKDIGSCWIGFVAGTANTPEIKNELNVPEGYEMVAPVILGYRDGPAGKSARKEPEIVKWLK